MAFCFNAGKHSTLCAQEEADHAEDDTEPFDDDDTEPFDDSDVEEDS